MRRLCVVFAAALVAAIPVGSSAAPVAVERNAFAMWRVGSGTSEKVIGVAVWTSRASDEVHEVGRFAVFEAICLDDDQDSCLIGLPEFLSGRANADEIEIDHLLGSARLDLTRRGRKVAVSWEGLDQAEPFAGEAYCGQSETGAVTAVERAASASGKAIGRRLPEGKLHSAELTAGTRLCVGGPGELRELLSSGRLTLPLR